MVKTKQLPQENQIPPPRLKLPPKIITCGICGEHFNSSSLCCDHMKVHSTARPKSSVTMTTSPKPHFSPPGSPLPKRPQTALATAFRKSPTPLIADRLSAGPMHQQKRSLSESFSSRGTLPPSALSRPMEVSEAWPSMPSPKTHKLFTCYYCQQEFSDALSLTKHSRTHGGATPYSCSQCGRMYALYSSLMTHEKSHTPERPNTCRCKTCGSLFLQEASLKAHQRRHCNGRTGPETKPYQCMTCHEWMSNEGSLRIHMQRHEEFDTPRICTLCGTSFSCDAFLRAHGKMHETEASTRCVICVRQFRRSKVTLRHSDLHVDGRQNVCDSCEKRFPKVADGSWRRMNMLVPEERKFQCLYCGVTFPRLHQLAAHETSHRDPPPMVRKRQFHLPSVIVN